MNWFANRRVATEDIGWRVEAVNQAAAHDLATTSSDLQRVVGRFRY